MKEYFIGVDWGGTRIKLGAVARNGVLLRRNVSATKTTANINTTFAILVKTIASLVKEVGGRPAGIGLGLSGPVDPDRGVMLLPGKIKGLEGFSIVPKLRKRFGVPVSADNDGMVALYAEKYFGHARGMRWVVGLTIGTGVGSGVMVDGRIPKDPNFMFGSQVGHLVINTAHDQLCLTGARGTAETLCSATALALAVRSGLQRGIPSTLTELYWKDPHAIDFKMIIEKGVARHDALCLDELRRWTQNLGWLLVSAVHAYSPEVIILSGGAVAASKYFLSALQKHVDQHIFRYPPGKSVPILVSKLGDHAGVLGAAMMVQERTKIK